MNNQFRIKSPSEPNRYDDYVENQILSDLFVDFLPEIARNPQVPFLIYEDTFPKLVNLVKDRKFFCFWLRASAKGIPETDDDGDVFYPDSELFSYEEPKEQIVKHLETWFKKEGQNFNKDVVDDFFEKELRKKIQNHFENEYYGDSSDYSYLSINKQEFIKNIQNFAKSQHTNKEKPKLKL